MKTGQVRDVHLRCSSDDYEWRGMCDYYSSWYSSPNNNYVDLDELEKVTCRACRNELKILAHRIETIRMSNWIKEENS